MPSPAYRVAWAPEAVRDAEEIVSFLATVAPAAARSLADRIARAARSLETFPDRGRVVPELARFGHRRWREMVLSPYRMAYKVESRTVLVVAVLDGRRDVEDILLDRLVRPRK